MEDLVVLLQGALRARGHVLLKLNVPAEQLDAVIAALPAMASPTVMTLAAGDMRALETVVPKKGVNTLIPALKSAGARDLLELPISKIVE
jgi:ATP phosphoribosyltransferase